MKTVFHLMSGESDKQETALTIAGNLLDDQSVDIDDVAVVAQSEGIEPFTADGNGADMVRSLVDEGVSFRACGNTMDLMDLDEADLVDGVETVPSGGGELTRLQDDGYAYIRPD